MYQLNSFISFTHTHNYEQKVILPNVYLIIQKHCYLFHISWLGKRRPRIWTYVWLTWKLRHFPLNHIKFLKWSVKSQSSECMQKGVLFTLRLSVLPWAGLMTLNESLGSIHTESSCLIMGPGELPIRISSMNEWIAHSKWKDAEEMKEVTWDLREVGKMK